MDSKTFGAFIARVRRERGMTQAELAARLHVTDKAVSRWERGVGMPDVASLEPLAQELGLSLLELMRSERISAEAVSPHEASQGIAALLQLALGPLRRARLRRLLGALITVALTLFCMLDLYQRAFDVNVTGDSALAAAIDAYHFNEALTVNILQREAVGRQLFVFFRVENRPNTTGLARLEKGLLGKYRFRDSDLRNWPLYWISSAHVSGQDYLLLCVPNSLPGVASWALYSDPEHSGEPVCTGPAEKAPGLRLFPIESGTTVNPFPDALGYYDEQGQEIPQEELLAPYREETDSWSGSAVGTAEAGLVYVLEGIVLLLGILITRYFLLPERAERAEKKTAAEHSPSI